MNTEVKTEVLLQEIAGDKFLDTERRVTRRMEVSSVLHQGDVYIHRLPDNAPLGALIAENSFQVAIGTGNGARHVAEGKALKVYKSLSLPVGVKAPQDVPNEEILGPSIVSTEPWCLAHPEHAHHEIPAGNYCVTYQYDPLTMRRVVD